MSVSERARIGCLCCKSNKSLLSVFGRVHRIIFPAFIMCMHSKAAWQNDDTYPSANELNSSDESTFALNGTLLMSLCGFFFCVHCRCVFFFVFLYFQLWCHDNGCAWDCTMSACFRLRWIQIQIVHLILIHCNLIEWTTHLKRNEIGGRKMASYTRFFVWSGSLRIYINYSSF